MPVSLRPREVSRAVRDVPDARLSGGPDGLVLRRPGREPEVLVAPGTPVTARWEDVDTLLTAPRGRLALPAVDLGGRLLVVPAGGSAVAVHEEDWTDGAPYAVDGPPAWARDLARDLGSRLGGPPASGPVRRVHPDPLVRRRRGLQVAFAALAVAPLTWGQLLRPVPGAFAALALLAQPLALLVLAGVGLLWLRGAPRLAAPLPAVAVSLAPAGGPLPRAAARRLRLGARPGELVVRDERGAEVALPTTGATWSRAPDEVRLLDPDGFLLLRLPLPVWAPDDASLVPLLDLLAASGAVAGPPGRASVPGPQDRVVPSPLRPRAAVPGIAGDAWYGLATALCAVGAVAGLTVVDASWARAWGLAQAVAVAAVALCAAVAHRHRTRTLRHGIMGGS